MATTNKSNKGSNHVAQAEKLQAGADTETDSSGCGRADALPLEGRTR